MRQKKLPNVLTRKEQKRLLGQPNPRYITGQRNHLLLKILLDTGLRLSEATSLRWRDLDLMSGKLKVVEGKGSKDRILWLPEEDIELLREWRQRQTEKAGIGKNVSPHVCRHTFGTDLLRQTKNIRLVQKALGHSRLNTTMIYTHIVDDELENELKSFRKKEDKSHEAAT